MLLDLKFTILTLGIGVGTFFAGLYGMNLKNFIEETDFGFPAVSVSCGIFATIAVVYGLRKLRKVQRLSMWGEGGSLDQGGVGKGRGGRGSWREVDPQRQLAGERGVRWKEGERQIGGEGSGDGVPSPSSAHRSLSSSAPTSTS